MPFDNWVLDATMGWPPCFCPVEGDLDGDYSIVTGLNLIGSAPKGKIVAVIHADGQEAANAFYETHRDAITALLSKRVLGARIDDSMSLDEKRFLAAMVRNEGVCSFSDLPGSTQAQKTARRRCKRRGWAEFSGGYWRITDAGRIAISKTV